MIVAYILLIFNKSLIYITAANYKIILVEDGRLSGCRRSLWLIKGA